MEVRDCHKQQELFLTELELCGLAINVASFSHLLKRVDFGAILDHLSFTHIIKVKQKQPLLE